MGEVAQDSKTSSRPPGYGELLRQPGVLAFVIPGAIGRLPLTMRSLGSALLVQELTGSYGKAGLVGAVVTILAAVAAPRLGRFADVNGVRGMVLATLVLQTLASIGLIVAAYRDAPMFLLLVFAALLGASSVSFGSISRAAWTRVVPRGLHLDRAFAFEAIVEEIAFIIGPSAAIPLILQVNPAAGIVASLLITATASFAFARLPASLTQTHMPPAIETSNSGDRKRSVLSVPGLRVLLPSLLLMGVVFGSAELMLVAFSREQGNEAASSLLVAIFAAGSVIGGLSYGWMHWKISLTRRLMFAVTWFAIALIPMIVVNALWLMALTVLITGLSISPSTIATMTLTERITPRSMVTEGFAWLSSAISAGAAIGTLVGGWLIDEFESNGAQTLCVVSGLGAAIVILGGRRWLRTDAAAA